MRCAEIWTRARQNTVEFFEKNTDPFSLMYASFLDKYSRLKLKAFTDISRLDTYLPAKPIQQLMLLPVRFLQLCISATLRTPHKWITTPRSPAC